MSESSILLEIAKLPSPWRGGLISGGVWGLRRGVSLYENRYKWTCDWCGHTDEMVTRGMGIGHDPEPTPPCHPISDCLWHRAQVEAAP